MRRGEISKLERSMLDQSSSPWVLRIPCSITKNAKGRSFGFDGEALAIMKQRVSGHRTDSMFRRYNIVEESETAAALKRADAWLSTQPLTRNVAVAGARQKREFQGQRHTRTL
jgi:hypothetical protein